MRSYGGPDPFCNGDFEEPLSPCWTIESPPVERRCSSGGCWARLGTEADDTKCEGNISPTTAVLAQTFRPTATGVLTFSFQYEIHSLDVLSTAYDTLLVYVGATRVFTLTHRHEPYGCNNPPLIMSNTVEIPVFVANDVPITLKYSLVNDHWYNTYADIDNVRIAYAR